MGHLSRDEKAWIAWFLATVGVFAYLEARAVRSRNRHATLTYVTRRALGIDPYRPWGFLGILSFSGFFAWLVVHIATGRFGYKIDTDA